MSRTTEALTFNVTAQTLLYRALQGRPTSATFAVFRDFNDDTTTPEFSGACTIDSVNTTVVSASGPSQSDPQRLNLTSTVGIVVKRKYLLSELGRTEWVEPIEIGTGYIRVRIPLRSDYSVAATFVSTVISAAVDPTWIANPNNITWYSNTWYATGRFGVAIGDQSDPFPGYRILYTFVVAGATYTAYNFFDVVRAFVTHSVDISDVNTRAPGLSDSLPIEYQTEDGRPLVDAAWRSVRSHLSSVNIDPESLRNDEVLDELVILRSLRLLAEGGWHPEAIPSAAYIALTSANYDNYFTQHVSVALKLRTAAGAGGASIIATALPFWRK